MPNNDLDTCLTNMSKDHTGRSYFSVFSCSIHDVCYQSIYSANRVIFGPGKDFVELH